MNEILTGSLVNKLIRKKEKNLFFYSLITALWLVLVIIILIFSTRKYIINLIINIVLTILFGFYSVYYFTIYLKNLNDEIRLAKRVDNGIINKEYYYFDKLLEVKENKDINIYIYNFITLDKKEVKLKSFEKIEESNKRYYIESKLDYIVSFKVSNE